MQNNRKVGWRDVEFLFIIPIMTKLPWVKMKRKEQRRDEKKKINKNKKWGYTLHVGMRLIFPMLKLWMLYWVRMEGTRQWRPEGRKAYPEKKKKKQPLARRRGGLYSSLFTSISLSFRNILIVSSSCLSFSTHISRIPSPIQPTPFITRPFHEWRIRQTHPP